MLWLPKWLRNDHEPGSTSIVVPELAVTRRTFLFLAGSAAASALVPAAPFDPVFSDPRTVDAILKESYAPWIAEYIGRPSAVGQFVLQDDGRTMYRADVPMRLLNPSQSRLATSRLAASRFPVPPRMKAEADRLAGRDQFWRQAAQARRDAVPLIVARDDDDPPHEG